MTPKTREIETPSGSIAFWDTGGEGPAVLFIHGNSSSKRIFQKQFASKLAGPFRLIAPDLPGHGESSEAKNPQDTYYIAGYAAALMVFLERSGIRKAHVVGWSLGGHIALELLARWRGAEGAFIFGTPPLPLDAERAITAFLPSDHMGLTFQEVFTKEEAAQFVGSMLAPPHRPEPWMIGDAMRTDGRTRLIGYQAAIEGRNLDEEVIVGGSSKPLAVLHGERDAFISLDFIDSLSYAARWGGKTHIIQGAGHTPQWEAPEQFNTLLENFLLDLARP